MLQKSKGGNFKDIQAAILRQSLKMKRGIIYFVYQIKLRIFLQFTHLKSCALKRCQIIINYFPGRKVIPLFEYYSFKLQNKCRYRYKNCSSQLRITCKIHFE